VIAGFDKAYYGTKLEKGTYKELVLQKFDIDLSRVHFVGALSYEEYKKLLQISSTHVYLTVPYVLSWSLLDALSCGCLVVSSKTPPVEEVINDNYNGILTDFFDYEMLAEKIEYALDAPDLKEIRKNARNFILQNYALEKSYEKYLSLIADLIKGYNKPCCR
jgi:glycosyltransferase involved in cell wall biosynthesis